MVLLELVLSSLKKLSYLIGDNHLPVVWGRKWDDFLLPPPPRLVFLCSSHDFIQCISCHDPSIWGGGCFQMLIKWLPVVSWVCSLTFHTLWELLCPFNILSFWWCLFRPSKLTCLKEAIPAGVLAMVVCQGDPSILFTSLETEDYKLELFNHE